MNGLLLLLPYFLLVHNTIDFGTNGANDSYKNRLNCVITDYIETIEEQNNLRLLNKTGLFDKTIEKIGLQFESTNTYDINGARILILALMDSLLTTLNGNDYLRPYFPACSLTSENIEIQVNFIGQCKYDYPSPNQIKYVMFKEKWISYYVVNPRNMTTLEIIRNEPLILSKILAPPNLYLKNCFEY